MTSKILTLDLEVDPLADGGRHPVAGYAHVGPCDWSIVRILASGQFSTYVTPAHAVKHQRGSAHTRG